MPRLLIQDKTASLEHRLADARATATMDFTRTAGQPFAAGAWVNPTKQTATNGGTIMGVRNGSAAGNLWKIGTGTNGILSLGYDITGSGASLSTTKYMIGTWNHVAMIYDGSYLIAYLNGVELTRSGSIPSAAINQTLFAIGIRADTSQEDYLGYIRDAFVSSNSLTASEVMSIYQTGVHPASVTHVWPMNEGTGTTAVDLRGSLNLTITIATWSTNVPIKLRTPSSSRSTVAQPRSNITSARATV